MSEKLHTSALEIAWSSAPWDEVVCGFPVLQITTLKVHGLQAEADMQKFESERDDLSVGLVSCRLPHDCLKESMFLEDRGFRFIEMVYTPELDLAVFRTKNDVELLVVDRAGEEDMPKLLDIARTAFQSERFKMDIRLDPHISNQRFQNWISSSLHHATQELYVIRDGIRIIAFFVTEVLSDGICYWHLNAVAPDAQGQGYGRRAWLSMIHLAASSGARGIRTSIAARNHRVINLYARLGFTFWPPTMTFHWVRTQS